MKRRNVLAPLAGLLLAPLACATHPSLPAPLPPGTGHLAVESIQREIHRHRSQIKTCYEEALGRVPDLQGKLVVGFTIDVTGAVTDVTVRSSTLRDPEFEECVTREVATFRFPKSTEGLVKVSYPFSFRPSEPPDGGTNRPDAG